MKEGGIVTEEREEEVAGIKTELGQGSVTAKGKERERELVHWARRRRRVLKAN